MVFVGDPHQSRILRFSSNALSGEIVKSTLPDRKPVLIPSDIAAPKLTVQRSVEKERQNEKPSKMSNALSPVKKKENDKAPAKPSKNSKVSKMNYQNDDDELNDDAFPDTANESPPRSVILGHGSSYQRNQTIATNKLSPDPPLSPTATTPAAATSPTSAPTSPSSVPPRDEKFEQVIGSTPVQKWNKDVTYYWLQRTAVCAPIVKWIRTDPALNAFDGETLVNRMDDDTTLSDLGVISIHRDNIRKEIQSLKLASAQVKAGGVGSDLEVSLRSKGVPIIKFVELSAMEPIGSGSFGEAFRAKWRGASNVVVKVLSKNDRLNRDAFEREGSYAA